MFSNGCRTCVKNKNRSQNSQTGAMKPQSHVLGPKWSSSFSTQQGGSGEADSLPPAWGPAVANAPSFYKVLKPQESTCRHGIRAIRSCPFLTCTGGGPWGMGWSREVKADMADMSTSSLTKMFPCTRVWISGDGGTVMYVEIWTAWERERYVWGSGRKQACWERSGLWSPIDLDSISTSALPCCVTLSKSLHLSNPHLLI